MITENNIRDHNDSFKQWLMELSEELKDVSIATNSKDIILLLGSTGNGKSTMIQYLCGLPKLD